MPLALVVAVQDTFAQIDPLLITPWILFKQSFRPIHLNAHIEFDPGMVGKGVLHSEKFLDLGTLTRPPSNIYARVNWSVIRGRCTRVLQGHP